MFASFVKHLISRKEGRSVNGKTHSHAWWRSCIVFANDYAERQRDHRCLLKTVCFLCFRLRSSNHLAIVLSCRCMLSDFQRAGGQRFIVTQEPELNNTQKIKCTMKQVDHGSIRILLQKKPKWLVAAQDSFTGRIRVACLVRYAYRALEVMFPGVSVSRQLVDTI